MGCLVQVEHHSLDGDAPQRQYKPGDISPNAQNHDLKVIGTQSGICALDLSTLCKQIQRA